MKLLTPLFIGLSLLCLPAFAETPNNAPAERRFEIIKGAGGTYRMDLNSGELEILKFDENGDPFWQKTRSRQGKVQKPQEGPVIESSTIDESSKKKKSTEAPDLVGPDGKPLAPVILEENRRDAAGDISAYDKSLSVCNAVQIGDRITGTFMIKNRGERKIKTLELTMFIPVVGQEKPQAYRFLFADHPDLTSPPKPSAPGHDPEALLQRVDIPCPAGHARGNTDLKVTYIKFAD
jgi:hypothetical protein